MTFFCVFLMYLFPLAAVHCVWLSLAYCHALPLH